MLGRLESGMEEFETCSRLGIGNGGVRAMFEACNRKLKSSSKVRGLESGMEEFEQSSKLGIGNGSVRGKFRRSIVAPPLRHWCGSQTAPPTDGNGACPLRHLY